VGISNFPLNLNFVNDSSAASENVELSPALPSACNTKVTFMPFAYEGVYGPVTIELD